VTHHKPLVSVGMPVYNGERCIRQALDSVVGQTYENLEVIISDNASTDNTAEICLEYAARDQRIQYHRNAVNLGVIANLRRVFELSSGDYFIWAAADDVRPATAVENCVAALLRNGSAVMAHGPVLVKLEGGEDLEERANEVHLADWAAAKRIRALTTGIRHNGMVYGLYRRGALAKGTLGTCLGQDYLLCLQMCLLGPVEYVKRPMIILTERGPVRTDNPMYRDRPLTLRDLLRSRRTKCWTVLLMGCYYLARIRSISLTQRIRGIAAHVFTFSQLYRVRLAKEAVFLLFTPARWLSSFAWRLGHRWSLSLRLARKVQAILTRV
jgi:glycosyltransferase involved in cell wall biosynthesis